MTNIEGALMGGSIGCSVGPLTVLFLARYAAKGWNSRAIAIHLEHDARVVGRNLLRRPAEGVPTAFKARGRVTI